MYAACSFTVGLVAGVSPITSFGQVMTWVAFAAALVVLVGLLRHVWPAGPHSPGGLTAFPALRREHRNGR